MRQQILEILEDLRPDLEFEEETELIDGGLLDSFDIISLVFELNEAFEIDVDVDELVPANFNSVSAMVELVEEKQE